MERSYKVYLGDIVESITLLESYTQDIPKTEFRKNIQLQDAALRRLQIMGEAVKHLPMEVKDKNPKIPWKEIAGSRDIFVREYFGIQLDRVWKTIKEDLPKLKIQIEELLQWNVRYGDRLASRRR